MKKMYVVFLLPGAATGSTVGGRIGAYPEPGGAIGSAVGGRLPACAAPRAIGSAGGGRRGGGPVPPPRGGHRSPGGRPRRGRCGGPGVRRAAARGCGGGRGGG